MVKCHKGQMRTVMKNIMCIIAALCAISAALLGQDHRQAAKTASCDLFSDSLIQTLVGQVSVDSMAAHIIRLQDFQTRHVFTDSSFAASSWLKTKMESLIYQTVFDSFYTTAFGDSLYLPVYEGYQRNVISIMTGQQMPTRHYILCGHLDTQNESDPYHAPGADDNASGTAAVLEISRIIRQHQWPSSVVLIHFDSEEEGVHELAGSRHYVQQAVGSGLDIRAVLNMDMIGYSGDSVLGCEVSGMAVDSWLRDLYVRIANEYTPGLVVSRYDSGTTSDAYSFAEVGYPAMLAMGSEWQHSPFYHQSTDLFGTLNMDQLALIAKGMLATLSTLLLSPDVVHNVSACPGLAPNTMVVSWDMNQEPDIAGYWLYWGLLGCTFSDSAYTSLTSDTVNGLINDTAYAFAVYAVNNMGRRSPGAKMASATIPSGVSSMIPTLEGSISMRLEQNYPNPFSSVTHVRFRVDSDAIIKLRVFDVTGRLVCTLADGVVAAGWHAAVWNRNNDNKSCASPGIFFIQLLAGGKSTVRRAVVQ